MADTKNDASGATANAAADGPRFIDARRRGFLQGAVIAGGTAVGGAALADHDAAHDIVEPAADKPVSAGYRETDHVREYYAKARF